MPYMLRGILEYEKPYILDGLSLWWDGKYSHRWDGIWVGFFHNPLDMFFVQQLMIRSKKSPGPTERTPGTPVHLIAPANP